MTLLQKIAHWASTVSYDDFTAPAVARAKECLQDVCAVTLAGSSRPLCRSARMQTADNQRSGTCRLIGTRQTADPAAAAMLNGLAAHILDFDDTCFPAAAMHPTAVLAPAVLAMGEELDISGQELITAYLTGFEISARMGLSAPVAVQKGWFTSSLFGTAGAAASAAKTLGLDPEAFSHAMGLALCQAGGMRTNNGTPAKAYSVGRAAANGLTSARMAAAGIQAAVDGLEGLEGFFDLYLDGKFDPAVFDRFGKPSAVLTPGVDFKPWPTCSSTHAAMEATLELKNAHLSGTDPAAIRCRISPVARRFLKYDAPQTIEQGMFSLPFCLVCILLYGEVTVAHLKQETLADPQIRALMPRVVVETTETFDHGRVPVDDCPEGAEIGLQTTNGQEFVKFVGHAHGAASRPFSPEDCERKFRTCAHGVLSQEKITGCLGCLRDLESVGSVRELTALLVPGK